MAWAAVITVKRSISLFYRSLVDTHFFFRSTALLAEPSFSWTARTSFSHTPNGERPLIQTLDKIIIL